MTTKEATVEIKNVPRLINGKIPIRAQLTSRGWKVVYATVTDGWSPLTDAVFSDHQLALDACRNIEQQNHGIYSDDN